MENRPLSRCPDFIYIGTSKAGSTWLFDILSRHPEVYMTPTKGLYFFDHHYDLGWQWYLEHFAAAGPEEIVAEISHSYLYSSVACERIAKMNPDVKLMVCLRNPIDRAFSMYLDGLRNEKWGGTFEQRIEDTRELVEEGCYARHLKPYLDAFPRQQIHITFFDELREDPATYARGVFDALQIAPMTLEPKLTKKVMPASLPRNKQFCQLAKNMSTICKQRGWKQLRGLVKRSRLIRSVLYREIKNSEKTIASSTRNILREKFLADVEQLDTLLGTQLVERWGFAAEHQPVVGATDHFS